MYRLILALVIIAFILRFIWLIKSDRWTYSVLLKVLNEELVRFNHVMSTKTEPFKILRKILYRITVLLFLILVISGFFPVLILGQSLSGFLLIVHVTVAPLFVLFFTLSVLFNAHSQQFDINDWNYVSRGDTEQNFSKIHHLVFWKKICFWLFTIFSLPAILSVIISMYPLFGTDGQYFLLDMHRYSVLFLFTIAAIFFLLKWSSAKVLAD